MLKFEVSPAAIAKPLALMAALLTALHLLVVTVHYEFVELEWLWRSLTYLKLQPMRLSRP